MQPMQPLIRTTNDNLPAPVAKPQGTQKNSWVSSLLKWALGLIFVGTALGALATGVTPSGHVLTAFEGYQITVPFALVTGSGLSCSGLLLITVIATNNRPEKTIKDTKEELDVSTHAQPTAPVKGTKRGSKNWVQVLPDDQGSFSSKRQPIIQSKTPDAKDEAAKDNKPQQQKETIPGSVETQPHNIAKMPGDKEERSSPLERRLKEESLNQQQNSPNTRIRDAFDNVCSKKVDVPQATTQSDYNLDDLAYKFDQIGTEIKKAHDDRISEYNGYVSSKEGLRSVGPLSKEDLESLAAKSAIMTSKALKAINDNK